MSFGFKAITSAGTGIVDDNFITLPILLDGMLDTQSRGVFVHQGVNKIMMMGAAYHTYYPYKIYTPVPPMIFLRPVVANAHGHFFVPGHFRDTDGGWMGFTIMWNSYSMEAWSLPTMQLLPFPYGMSGWGYTVVSPMDAYYSGATNGVRTWDANGKLAFDSGIRVAKIKRIITGWGSISGVNGGQVAQAVEGWGLPKDGTYGFLAPPLESLGMAQAPKAGGGNYQFNGYTSIGLGASPGNSLIAYAMGLRTEPGVTNRCIPWQDASAVFANGGGMGTIIAKF